MRYLWVPQSTVDTLKSITNRMRKAGEDLSPSMVDDSSDAAAAAHLHRSPEPPTDQDYSLRAYSYHSVLKDELTHCQNDWLSMQEHPSPEITQRMVDRLLGLSIVAFDTQFVGWYLRNRCQRSDYRHSRHFGRFMDQASFVFAKHQRCSVMF